MAIRKYIHLQLTPTSGSGSITIINNLSNQAFGNDSKIYFREAYVVSSATGKIYQLEIPNLITDTILTNISSHIVIPLYIGYSFSSILVNNNAYINNTYNYNVYEASSGSLTADTLSISIVFSIEDV